MLVLVVLVVLVALVAVSLSLCRQCAIGTSAR
jgi:hypothetical protein